MSDGEGPAKAATEIEGARGRSNYPAPFRAAVGGRIKRRLGDAFGLTTFGVNHTTLEPGAMSALFHRHTAQEEFVYILDGAPTLITDDGAQRLAPGMCVGFPPNGLAHHLVNETDAPVVYLEIGDRPVDDGASYPQDDLVAQRDGAGWRFTRKSGEAY